MDRVHASAALHPKAVVAEDLRAGPYAVVEDGARIATGCVLGPHAVVLSGAELGPDCVIHPFAVVGGPPQDLRHDGSATRVVLGRGVQVREHATVHRGSSHGTRLTRIGEGALLMAYAHVAHDCEVGAGVVLANGVQLAGHVVVEPFAVFGGMALVAQCVRVGEGAMVAAGARVETDVPPYHVVAGDRARVRGLNVVGLARRGTDPAVVRALVELHRALFRRGTPLASALGAVRVSPSGPRELAHLVEFLQASLAAPRRRAAALRLATDPP